MSENIFSVVKTTYNKITSGVVPVVNGQMIFTTDTQQIFFDYDGERKYYCQPISKTLDEWKADITYIPPKGQILVYEDYYTITDENGNQKKMPAFKVGDGLAYGIDLPVISKDYELAENIFNHINNTDIHVSPSDRDF